MARGQILSLEEARKQKRLDRFCKKHASEGDVEIFDELLNAMAMVKCSGEAEQT